MEPRDRWLETQQGRSSLKELLNPPKRPQETEGFDWTCSLMDDDGEYDEAAYSDFVAELCERFYDAPEGQALEARGLQVGFWVEIMFDYGLSYCGVNPSDLQPEHLHEILFNIVPKKVSCQATATEEIVAELGAFWAFAAREFGVSNLDDYQRVLEEAEQDQPLTLSEDIRVIREAGIRNAEIIWKEYREAVVGGWKDGSA